MQIDIAATILLTMRARSSKDHCSPRANRQLQSTGTAGSKDIIRKEIIPPPQRILMLPVSLAWRT